MGVMRSKDYSSHYLLTKVHKSTPFDWIEHSEYHTGTPSTLDYTSTFLDESTASMSVVTENINQPTSGHVREPTSTDSLDDRKIATLSWDDATWILTSSFIIFTMQTGFGLIEAGSVNAKNEVNIMVKNAIDVIFGGISYWAFGFGLTFGIDKGTNPFCGVGYWFVESRDQAYMGQLYSTFIFQLSFATTATTIVSGAMAERTKLRAYIVFSLLNTIIYCIPAHWIWAKNGFLHGLGCVDVAGSGAVHLLGAGSAFVAAWMLGPRTGRYDKDQKIPEIGNGTNAMIGMFMLWWGWLAFNSGSTFGISGKKWILAARAAVVTLNGSMGGGAVAIIFSSIKNKGQLLIPDLITGTLGSLVSVTASCALIQPWEGVVIGALGGLLCCASPMLINKIKVDDPVGAVAVHGIGGLWGMVAVGIFVDIDPLESLGGNSRGLIHGGGFYLLGVQTLACVMILAWSMALTWLMLFAIQHTIGLRLSEWDEQMGSDFIEHGIHSEGTQGMLENIHGNWQPRRTSLFGGRKSSNSSQQIPISVPYSGTRYLKWTNGKEDTLHKEHNGHLNGVLVSTEEISEGVSERLQTSQTDIETAGLY